MESCLWPVRTGTWRERAVAAAMLLEFLGLWGSYYLLAWALQR
jgi:hypothetical protein